MTHPFWDFVMAHQAVIVLASFWIFSAAVGAMQPPTATSSPFYFWFYTFANSIAANVEQAARAKGLVRALPPKEPPCPPIVS